MQKDRRDEPVEFLPVQDLVAELDSPLGNSGTHYLGGKSHNIGNNQLGRPGILIGSSRLAPDVPQSDLGVRHPVVVVQKVIGIIIGRQIRGPRGRLSLWLSIAPHSIPPLARDHLGHDGLKRIGRGGPCQ